MKSRIFLMAAAALTLAASASSASAQDLPIGWPSETSDCTCTAQGHWDATNPDQHGIWAGGYCEDHINVRRCRELTQACTPGQEQNIYTSPAPAIVDGPCP